MHKLQQHRIYLSWWNREEEIEKKTVCSFYILYSLDWMTVVVYCAMLRNYPVWDVFNLLDCCFFLSSSLSLFKFMIIFVFFCHLKTERETETVFYAIRYPCLFRCNTFTTLSRTEFRDRRIALILALYNFFAFFSPKCKTYRICIGIFGWHFRILLRLLLEMAQLEMHIHL